MILSRRHFITTATAAGLVVPQFPASAQQPPGNPAGSSPFSFDRVKDKAADLAKTPYKDPPADLPSVLKSLDYEHFRMINFRPEQALWRDGGLFQLQLFHRGFQYDRRVIINTVENGEVRELTYSPDQFDFRQNGFKADFTAQLGFSGLRLHFPLNRSDYFDEFAVFQGASYFRLVGRNQQYGLSGRGLAIDTAGPQGEEFPWFREFWVERPAFNSRIIPVYALLDSKSTTGAYRFMLAPGSNTVANVEFELYPRLDIKKLGVAPLTSMFLHGKPGNRPFVDVRPETHDSDGLMLHTGAEEWIWRPVTNPRALQVTAFSDKGPRGFGLMQRERDYRQYQDIESNYQTRPSAWTEPDSDWGSGAVELVEIPSDEDVNDNLVAYWVPAAPVKAKESIEFRYKITMLTRDDRLEPLGRCVATRSGPVKGVDVGREDRHGPHRFAIEFTGGEIPTFGPAMPVEVHFSASGGTIMDISGHKFGSDSWRAVFTYTPDGSNDADLRGYLALRGEALTETWTFHWSGA